MLFGLLNFQGAKLISAIDTTVALMFKKRCSWFQDVGIFQPSRLRLEFGGFVLLLGVGFNLLHSDYITFKLKVLPT
jgi:hypothetical protein